MIQANWLWRGAWMFWAWTILGVSRQATASMRYQVRAGIATLWPGIGDTIWSRLRGSRRGILCTISSGATAAQDEFIAASCGRTLRSPGLAQVKRHETPGLNIAVMGASSTGRQMADADYGVGRGSGVAPYRGMRSSPTCRSKGVRELVALIKADGAVDPPSSG